MFIGIVVALLAVFLGMFFCIIFSINQDEEFHQNDDDIDGPALGMGGAC